MAKKGPNSNTAALDEALEAAEKKIDLKDKLTKDLKSAQTQYETVLKQLDQVQNQQQILAKQKIALEALINYIKTSLEG